MFMCKLKLLIVAFVDFVDLWWGWDFLKLYGPFLWMSSTASRLEPLGGHSLLFTTKFPEIPGICPFYRSRRDGRHSRAWSHPVVLNTGPLDWEYSALTTRPFFLLRGERGVFVNGNEGQNFLKICNHIPVTVSCLEQLVMKRYHAKNFCVLNRKYHKSTCNSICYFP